MTILSRAKRRWERLSARPGIAHLVRAGKRFSDRQGTQFAASITYFSFLSLVPILMLTFSAAGFVLSSHPELLDRLKDEVASFMPPDIGTSIIDQSIKQRLTIGLVGLVVALYSGLNWMGNVRAALRAQWRPRWEMRDDLKPNFLLVYLRDLGSLAGLGIAMVASITLTAVGTAAQDLVVGWLGLDDVGLLRQVLRFGPFVIAITAGVLIFAWVYTILPHREYRADLRTLLIGALAMSVVFEVLKSALTLLVTRMAASPAGGVFGSIIGLLLFFNLVARAFLMIGAWIATGITTDDPAPGSDDDVPPDQVADTPAVPATGAAPDVTVDAGRRLLPAFGVGVLVGLLRRRR